MLGKLLAVVVLVVVGVLANENGRTIEESHVREHYRQQLEAWRSFDEEAVCKGIAGDFSVKVVEHGGARPVNATLDGPGWCEMSRISLRLAQQLSNQTGGLLTIELNYDLKSIEIAPDGRSAKIAATSTAKLGDTLISRTRGFEHFSRSFWRMRSHGGEVQVWSYGG